MKYKQKIILIIAVLLVILCIYFFLSNNGRISTGNLPRSFTIMTKVDSSSAAASREHGSTITVINGVVSSGTSYYEFGGMGANYRDECILQNQRFINKTNINHGGTCTSGGVLITMDTIREIIKNNIEVSPENFSTASCHWQACYTITKI
jgi:hypothetical protein